MPAALCDPQRTAISRPCSRAKLTEAATSDRLTHRAITAGRRSISVFHSARTVSYAAAPRW